MLSRPVALYSQELGRMGREDQVVFPQQMDVAGLGDQRHDDMEAAGRAPCPGQHLLSVRRDPTRRVVWLLLLP